MTITMQHISVLQAQVIHYLAIKPAGRYVDATFGRGGHSQAILAELDAQGRLWACDQDPMAILHGQASLGQDPRFSLVQGNFSDLAHLLPSSWHGQVQGIVLDLGVCSTQIDSPERGFSFQQAGPLDMRMDVGKGLPLSARLPQVKEADLAQVLWEYGEERYARRVARAILQAWREKRLETTLDLAAVIKAAIPRWEAHKHPATRSFQALRIWVNDELGALQRCLESVHRLLAIGGRLAVISFHSLEDRLVKQFIQQGTKGDDYPIDLPIPASALRPQWKKIARVYPDAQEVAANRRARSAVMRVAEKIGE